MLLTLPYKLMHAITNSIANPLSLIWLQIIIGALAVGVMVYVISREDVALALSVGLLLATDLLWGSLNRMLLTEGPFISFHLLAMAWLLSHYDRRSSVRTRELLLAGLFYGWTFLFRPCVGLAPPSWARTHRWRRCRLGGVKRKSYVDQSITGFDPKKT
jgi:dolichyl-phosphate-mannose--protein O-mannosyl transferase